MNELERALEALVDTHGLGRVVESLRDICNGKAEHVASNWQDGALATAWERNAGKLNTLAGRLTPTT